MVNISTSGGPEPDPEGKRMEADLSLPGRQSFLKELKGRMKLDRNGRDLQNEGLVERAEALVLRILTSGPKSAIALQECLQTNMGSISKVSFYLMMGRLIVDTREVEQFIQAREGGKKGEGEFWYRKSNRGDGSRLQIIPPTFEPEIDPTLV